MFIDIRACAPLEIYWRPRGGSTRQLRTAGMKLFRVNGPLNKRYAYCENEKRIRQRSRRKITLQQSKRVSKDRTINQNFRMPHHSTSSSLQDLAYSWASKTSCSSKTIADSLTKTCLWLLWFSNTLVRTLLFYWHEMCTLTATRRWFFNSCKPQ